MRVPVASHRSLPLLRAGFVADRYKHYAHNQASVGAAAGSPRPGSWPKARILAPCLVLVLILVALGAGLAVPR